MASGQGRVSLHATAEFAEVAIEQLHKRHGGVTPEQAAFFSQAASVCLAKRNGSSPAEFDTVVERQDLQPSTAQHLARWTKPASRTESAWSNSNEATEFGACGVVIAAIEREHGLFVCSRAETKTGADYFVSPVQDLVGLPGMPNVDDVKRLEVSGCDAGNASVVRRRVTEKVEQTKRGESGQPAIAAVVGFACQLVHIRHV